MVLLQPKSFYLAFAKSEALTSETSKIAKYALKNLKTKTTSINFHANIYTTKIVLNPGFKHMIPVQFVER